MVDISIIVISYNHEKYISETFESILKQKTEYSFEILVGDDCSKDNTREIIEIYQNKYPNIVRNINRENNMGASSNLYDLMEKAKGKYIAFCEGDDYWADAGRIQGEVDFLQNNVEFSGICGKTIPVDENGKILKIEKIDKSKRFWLFNKNEFTIEDFQKWRMPGHLSALTLRNFMLIQDIDFSIIQTAHDIVADRTVAMLGVLQGTIKVTEEVSSYYRFRTNETNFMSKMVQTNFRLDDFEMIVNLENYVHKYYTIEFSLDYVKYDRLVGATVVWMKNRNCINRRVLVGIIKASGEKCRYLCRVLYIIAVKLFYWKILKQDTRMEYKGGKENEIL